MRLSYAIAFFLYTVNLSCTDTDASSAIGWEFNFKNLNEDVPISITERDATLGNNENSIVSRHHNDGVSNNDNEGYASGWKKKPISCELRFIKVPKCGSSTNAGVARRIGAKYDLNGVFGNLVFRKRRPSCSVLSNHLSLRRFAPNRDNHDIFLYSFIRHPAKRYVSEYYHFHVTRHGASTEPKKIVDWLSHVTRNYMTNYLIPRADYCQQHRGDCAKQLLSEYDFMGIVEREHESLVVLKYVLGLDYSDILYFNAKMAGGYDDIGYKLVSSKNLPQEAKDYLSGEFVNSHTIDFELYKLANEKLDKTIESIGPGFKNQLEKFEALIDLAHEYCKGEVVFPYNQLTGEDQREIAKESCYWHDNGCGYPCLDKLIKSSEYQKIAGV